jgi:glutamate dehydrogenase/leucine dehydrogenase
MRSAYLAVGAVAKERQVDLRTAAYILAIRRVAQATLSRRPMRQSIQI